VSTADVIIPTFNDGDLLGRAIDSALALPFVSRVIVVDDGSQTPARAPADDERVTLIRTPNRGPSAARNTGLDASTAPRVIFCDADDALTSGIERSLELASEHNAAVTLCGRIEVTDGAPDRERLPPPEYAGALLPDASDVWRPLWLFATPGAVVCRRVIEAGVRFDERIRIGEDRAFFADAAGHGPIAVSGALGVRYTKDRAGSLMSATHADRRAADFLLLAARYADAGSDRHWRVRYAQLVKALARSGRDPVLWRDTLALGREHGWHAPVRARAGRLLRRLLQ